MSNHEPTVERASTADIIAAANGHTQGPALHAVPDIGLDMTTDINRGRVLPVQPMSDPGVRDIVLTPVVDKPVPLADREYTQGSVWMSAAVAVSGNMVTTAAIIVSSPPPSIGAPIAVASACCGFLVVLAQWLNFERG